MTAPVSSVASTTSQAGKSEHEQAEQGGEIADGEDRADAEIDAAGDQGEGHAERDEAEFGEQPHQRQRVR